MTDPPHAPVRLVGSGSTFDHALELLLRAAIDLISAGSSHEAADRSVRFRAEAPTREELVSACLMSILDQVGGFDARPATVTLDGVRSLDAGYRAWGSLYLDPAQDGVREHLIIEAPPEITVEPQLCHIAVSVAVIHEL
jgi:hypothetical protein